MTLTLPVASPVYLVVAARIAAPESLVVVSHLRGLPVPLIRLLGIALKFAGAAQTAHDGQDPCGWASAAANGVNLNPQFVSCAFDGQKVIITYANGSSLTGWLSALTLTSTARVPQ